jgi:glycosidase
MKKHLLSLIVIFVFIIQNTYGQVVSTIPKFPMGDKEITIIFDLKQAKDVRAKGLLGKTDDVYLWSGAGSTAAGDAFEFQPTGQTEFSKIFAPGKMTALGNDRWSIKLAARSYYNVPAAKGIEKLGLLLKSGDGKAQTEDVIIKMYDGTKLYTALLQPTEKSLFVVANQTVDVSGIVSIKSNITLSVDNQTVKSETNADSLGYSLNTGNAAGTHKVIFKAQSGTQVAADSFSYTIAPTPIVAALPAGLKDGINYVSANKVILSLFAPLKKFVYVIGEFNNWQIQNQYLMNRTPDGTRYWLEINNLVAGQEYAYQYSVDGTVNVGDPYCEKILDPKNDAAIGANYPNLKAYPLGASGIVSVLQTNQTPYNWKVPNFKRPDSDKLVVYELLVRDFTASRRYKAVADSLVYLKKLGINAIEIMPIMEFTNNDSWGYNPTYFVAPDKAYGTKDELKALIDKCHENGIAIVLDMVLNQADYENPYVRMYWDGAQPTKDSPFFNQTATHPYSPFFDFNHESLATKELVDNVCKFWIQEYKFDGFRFDLSKGFTQVNSGSNVGLWGNYDASRVAIWKRIYDKIRSYDPTAYVILEHFADNSEETVLANYGMMFWGNSNDDYRKAAGGFTRNMDWVSYKKRGWNSPNILGYMESHDEERQLVDILSNGRSNSDYTVRELKTALDRMKLAAAFFLPVPGPKMIWQFGEFGYDISIDQGGRTGSKPQKWEYQTNPDRAKLLRVYQELIKIKKTIQVTDFDVDMAGMVKKIAVKGPNQMYILGNFDIIEMGVEAGFPATGKWYDYFTGQEITVTNTKDFIALKPGEFHIYTTTKLPTPEAGIVPWTVGFSPITSVQEQIENQPVILYPNPAQDQITIDWTANYRGNINVEMIDITGKNMAKTKFQKSAPRLQATWDISQIKTGTYLLRIVTADEVFVRKLIVK